MDMKHMAGQQTDGKTETTIIMELLDHTDRLTNYVLYAPVL
jgi:hypothetical protein